jgi:hypothetical protein
MEGQCSYQPYCSRAMILSLGCTQELSPQEFTGTFQQRGRPLQPIKAISTINTVASPEACTQAYTTFPRSRFSLSRTIDKRGQKTESHRKIMANYIIRH